mmetsp:Transcript_5636/g.10532  ORF Transcript_5636/g.10532 Transcript_5636/m.10532 type:complete len:83 (-) Transcript_5636:270-518(-)
MFYQQQQHKASVRKPTIMDVLLWRELLFLRTTIAVAEFSYSQDRCNHRNTKERAIRYGPSQDTPKVVSPKGAVLSLFVSAGR